MPQKCSRCPQGKKLDAVSDTIRLCVAHYVDAYIEQGRQAFPANQRFSQLPQDARDKVGKALGVKLQGTNAPLQATTYDVYDPYWASALDKIASANEFGTCVALCPWGTELLIAINSGATVATLVKMEKLKKIAGAASQRLKEGGVDVDTFIFLSDGAPETYTWDNTGNLQLQGVPLAVQCDQRDTVHAELRILEYLHLSNAGNAAVDVYIAISKPCCVKCESVMQAYNAWNNAVVTVQRQGSLTGLFGQWKIPNGLKPLTNDIVYWRELKNATM